VASVLITPSLKKLCFGTRGGIKVIKLEAIMGWAKSHLSLGGDETIYDNVVIPYHGEAHWNLLALEPFHTFQFNSKIGVHDYSTPDIFIQQICRALLLLQGVHHGDLTFNELVEKLVLNVPIFTHVGSWECVTSHILCQYLASKASLNNQTIKEPKVGFQHQCYICNTFKT
jgi:hypothetical protein